MIFVAPGFRTESAEKSLGGKLQNNHMSVKNETKENEDQDYAFDFLSKDEQIEFLLKQNRELKETFKIAKEKNTAIEKEMLSIIQQHIDLREASLQSEKKLQNKLGETLEKHVLALAELVELKEEIIALKEKHALELKRRNSTFTCS